MAGAVQRLNTRNRFDVLPWQTPGLLERVNLTAQQCMEAAWYVDEAGHTFRGAAAVNAALGALGGVFALVSLPYRIPGVKQIEDALYAWVARNRYRLPGASDACQLPNSGNQHGS